MEIIPGHLAQILISIRQDEFELLERRRNEVERYQSYGESRHFGVDTAYEGSSGIVQ